jgi:hypothetical protein
MLEVSWFGRCKRRGKTGRRKTRVQTAASGKITAQGGKSTSRLAGYLLGSSSSVRPKRLR